MRPVWVVTQPRSGSWYLCRMLNNTGLFKPEFKEYFNPYDQYFNRRVNAYSNLFKNPDAYRHCKIFPGHFRDNFMNWNGINEKIPDIKYVHLVREDIVAKAVSHYFAVVTDKWGIHNEGEKKEYVDKPIQLDEQKLIEVYRHVSDNHNFWLPMIKGKDYIQIRYEDLVRDPAGQLQAILASVGHALPSEAAKECVAKVKSLPMTRPETPVATKALARLIRLRRV